jgi:hypothetical protein
MALVTAPFLIPGECTSGTAETFDEARADVIGALSSYRN